MNVVNGKSTERQRPANCSDAAEELTTEHSGDGPTRYGHVTVATDRRAAATVGRLPPENSGVMKRKTLHRYDDGQVSVVSESFTESETVDDGICLLYSLS